MGNAAFAAYLRGRIAHAGLSQSEVVARSGLKSATLSRKLRGQGKFSATDLVALAPVLHVAPGELLDAAVADVSMVS